MKKSEIVTALLCCVSYLAETPSSCKEKVEELLDYMLSIEGEDESRFDLPHDI